MEYNYKIINMCERRMNPDSPEYLNSLSALYMCYISYYYLTNTIKLSNTVLIIYLLIFANGIGSFLYHWFAWYIFKLLDEFTMIIPIWIGICSIMNDLNYKTEYIALFTLFNMFLIVFDVFMWFQDYFPLFFAAEMLLIIPLYIQSIKKIPDIQLVGLKGIIICSCAGIMWFTIESNCNKYLTFGHALWHIGMSNGLCNIIEYFNQVIN